MENTIEDNSVFEMAPVYEEKYYKHPLQDQFRFIRLMDFEEIKFGMKDLTSDGGVKKRIVENGIGNDMALPSSVKFKFNAYIEFGDQPFDSTYLRKTTERLIIYDPNQSSESNCIIGLVYALKSMKKKEKSQFIISPEYGYGKLGVYPRIPPQSELFYEIELLDFSNNLEEGIFDSKLQTESVINYVDIENVVNQLKLEGNDFFKENLFMKAEQKYFQALKKLNHYRPKNGNEVTKCQNLEVILKLNSANCFIKLCRGGRACNLCREVLSIDPRNVKSYYLLSLALWSMSQYRSSLFYLRKAHRMMPENTLIIEKLSSFTEEIKNIYKYAPEMAGNLKRRKLEFNEATISSEFKVQCQDLLLSIKKDKSLLAIPADFFDITAEEYDYLSEYFGKHGFKVSKAGAHPNTVVYISV